LSKKLTTKEFIEKSIELHGCKSINHSPFDFYLPNLNMCIEYDGIQHFKSVDFFGGDEEFKKRKLHDNIKTQYCKDVNIILLRISYKENTLEKLIQNLKN